MKGKEPYAIGLAFFVHVIARSAKGDKKMGIGSETTDPLELAGMGAGAIVVTLVVLLPLILFNLFVVYRGLGEGEGPGASFWLNLPIGIASFA